MSNGNESTPERCVHAVDGPDWAGLREHDPKHENLIEWLRDFTGAGSNGTNEAADVIEALVAENENLRAEALNYRDRLHESEAAEGLIEAERDALQGRLDAMTVEWAVHWIPGDTYHDAPTEADAVSLAGEFVRSKAQAVQRLVGPWTVVPEGEQP